MSRVLSLLAGAALACALAFPAAAVTAVGAAGAVGGPDDAALSTVVAISQVVLAPVPTVALGVAPADASIWSSARDSMSEVLETFERCVQPGPAVRLSPKPESTYIPIASSLPAVVAAVGPEATDPAPPVVPLACAIWSTTEASPTVDRPEYSETAALTSAREVGVTVIAGRVPPPAFTGAVHTLISVPSEALKCSSSMYAFPAESDTFAAVAPELFHTPATTTKRLPVVILALGVSFTLMTPEACAATCCTKAGEELVAPAETTRQQQTIRASGPETSAAKRTALNVPRLRPRQRRFVAGSLMAIR